jgi:hypothetical protein
LRDTDNNVVAEDDVGYGAQLHDFDEKSRSFLLANANKDMRWHDKWFNIHLGEFKDGNNPQHFLEAIFHASQYGVVVIYLEELTTSLNVARCDQGICPVSEGVRLVHTQVDDHRIRLLERLPEVQIPKYAMLLRDENKKKWNGNYHKLKSQIKALPGTRLYDQMLLRKLMQERFDRYVVLFNVKLNPLEPIQQLAMLSELVSTNSSVVGGLLILGEKGGYHSIAFFECTNGSGTKDVYYCNTWGYPCEKLTNLFRDLPGFPLDTAILLSSPMPGRRSRFVLPDDEKQKKPRMS